MPPVYAVISFFSYRFFRSYTYYSLIESVYEAVTLSAFLLLLIEYVADTATGHNALKAMERKDKRPLPIPRDDSTYEFASVALYGLFLFYGLTKEELAGRRPLAKFLSIKLIVMFTFYQSFIVSMLSSHGVYPYAHLESATAQFTSLEGRVIKATEYWTATNIADGLNALAICIEMVFFSGLMMWAYNVDEYKTAGSPSTSIGRPLWDSINY
ncbi:hypothetical protein ID866_6371, partial [Astraeus odoratus]